VNGISRDVRIAVLEVDIDYNQVVDVVQMVSDLICGDLACNVSHNKISRGPAGNLVGDVGWHVELSICPTELELMPLAWNTARLETYLTLFMCR
jgi:hypothetical protein